MNSTPFYGFLFSHEQSEFLNCGSNFHINYFATCKTDINKLIFARLHQLKRYKCALYLNILTLILFVKLMMFGIFNLIKGGKWQIFKTRRTNGRTSFKN